MATRFTRVTIVGGDRQVDVSLPASAPLAEQLPTVLRLLSMPTGAGAQPWALSTSEFGALALEKSLDEVGILDGMVLHLTPVAEAAESPFVDDVEASASERVGLLVPAFAGAERRSAISCLLAVIGLLGLYLTTAMPTPVSWITAAVIAVASLGIGAYVQEPGGAAAAFVAVPAAALVVLAVQSPADGLTAADKMLMVSAAALAMIAVGLVRANSAATVPPAVAAIVALLGWAGIFAGMPAYRVAGVAVVLAIVCAGLAGQFALGGAGLVNLMVADERGEKVPRAVVNSAVLRGTSVATGIAWACGLIGAASVWKLMGTILPGPLSWGPPAFAAVASLAFALRSRIFSRARQVVPMLLVPLIGAAAAALQLPRWFGTQSPVAAATTVLGGLVIAGAVLAATGFAGLGEVPRMRLRRLYEGLEFMAVLLLIPGLIVLFDVISAMRRGLTG